MRVAILTPVLNRSLYNLTKTSYPNFIDLYNYDGNFRIYGLDAIELAKTQKSKNYDYVILADEDFIVTDKQNLFSILKYLFTNDIDICGVRDGVL